MYIKDLRARTVARSRIVKPDIVKPSARVRLGVIKIEKLILLKKMLFILLGSILFALLDNIQSILLLDLLIFEESTDLNDTSISME